jgi:predicted phosphodiesterase
MRFAAIADIHGNVLALEAVLADLAALGIEDVVNLGDHLSGPLEAARTADLLIERGFPSVRGDQDRIQVELVRAGDLRRSDVRQLVSRHVDWLASLPPTLSYRDDVLLCHAAPDDDAAFWLDEVAADGVVRPSALDKIEDKAKGIDASLILCGHTHIPRVVRLCDGRMVVKSRQRRFARLSGAASCSVSGRGGHAACVLRHPGARPCRLVDGHPLRCV